MAASQWTAKADAIADTLLKDLTLRLGTNAGPGLLTAGPYTVTKSFDANDSAPILTVNGATAGQPGGSIKIRGVLPFGKDSLGNAQNNYGMPHEVILVTENRTLLANADTYPVVMQMLASVLRLGALIHWQVTAAATAPTIANGAIATDVTTFDNLQYPGVGSI